MTDESANSVGLNRFKGLLRNLRSQSKIDGISNLSISENSWNFVEKWTPIILLTSFSLQFQVVTPTSDSESAPDNRNHYFRLISKRTSRQDHVTTCDVCQRHRSGNIVARKSKPGKCDNRPHLWKWNWIKFNPVPGPLFACVLRGQMWAFMVRGCLNWIQLGCVVFAGQTCNFKLNVK